MSDNFAVRTPLILRRLAMALAIFACSLVKFTPFGSTRASFPPSFLHRASMDMAVTRLDVVVVG